MVFWEIRSLQKFSNLSGQLYWDLSVWSSGKNLATTDTKWALKTSGVSSDGRLLFAGLWPLVSVVITLHMGWYICFISGKVIKIFFLSFPHKVIYTVPLLLIFYNYFFVASYTCPSVTWLAVYQCSAMVEGFAVSAAFFSSIFFYFFFFLRWACLLITSRNKSIQCDSATLGSLKLFTFSKGITCKSIKKALSSNCLKHR